MADRPGQNEEQQQDMEAQATSVVGAQLTESQVEERARDIGVRADLWEDRKSVV